MKRIKTLSILSTITALAGIAVSMVTPCQISAMAGTPIKPGDDLPAKTITAHPEDFDDKHTKVKSNNQSGWSKWLNKYNQNYVDPVFKGNKQWLIMQGDDTQKGTSSVAFNRPFKTDADFSVSADVNLSSENSGGEFNTDFVGLVLSTVPAAKLADSQYIPWAGNGAPDHAGFGTPDVEWQTAFGTQGFDSSENTTTGIWPLLTTHYAHLDVVRETTGNNRPTLGSQKFFTDKGNRTISRSYLIKYDAHSHYVTYSLVVNKQAQEIAKNQIPADIDKIYIGAFGAVNGNSDHDTGGITMGDLSGEFVQTKTTVHFVDENNKNMSPDGDATISSIVGENLSVGGGSGDEDWDAPTFDNYELTGSPADRTITTVENEKDNNIYVRYKKLPAALAYKIIDDSDNGAVLVHGTVPNVNLGDSYNDDTIAPLKKKIPAFTELGKIENTTGTLQINKDGNVSNPPVIIHVTHSTNNATKDFTRGVHYIMPNGSKATPPTPVSEDFQVTESTDLYLQNKNPDYKPTFKANKTLGDYVSPNVEGYAPDKLHVDLSQEKFDDKSFNDPDNKVHYEDVTYHGILQVYPPSIDFGTVHYGDRVFDGADDKGAVNLQGNLDMAITDPAKADTHWYLKAKLDDNFMIGDPYIKFMGKEITSTGQKGIVNYTNVNDGDMVQPGIYRILDSSRFNGHPDLLKQVLSIHFTDLRNQNINTNAGDKQYSGTITWTVGTAPE